MHDGKELIHLVGLVGKLTLNGLHELGGLDARRRQWPHTRWWRWHPYKWRGNTNIGKGKRSPLDLTTSLE